MLDPAINPSYNNNDNNNTDDNMDIDMDIDLEVDPEIARLEAEAMRIEAQTAMDTANATHGSGLADFNMEFSFTAVPEKVHVRGLENLTTADIKQFASEHFPTDQFARVEWIDDTSANIIYKTAEAASEALNLFTDPQSAPASIPAFELRNAKQLSSHPNSTLQVRQASEGDIKAPRAHERSRFYLMNPDKDPRERRKEYDGRRGRGGRHRDERGERGDYQRRAFDDLEHRRRKYEEKAVSFDINMYDDDSGASAKEVPRGHRSDSSPSLSSGETRQRRRVRVGDRARDDLFMNKADGRLRNRSASPIRDGDGRFGFNDDQPVRRTARRRSLSPPPAYRQRDPDPHPRQNVGKELFPGQAKSTTRASPAPATDSDIIDLFPAKLSPHKRNRELFPHKTSLSNHRRSDALDADETADLFSNRMSVPFVDGSTDAKPTAGANAKSADLASRTSATSSSFGRLHNRPFDPDAAQPETQSGFSIRGSATSTSFSIKGAAREAAPVKELFPKKELFLAKELFPKKELFPMKAGNAGKELFGEKIKGRGGPRRKAEDMFF
ncbi:hypothetical protein B0A49_07208 [Cryomyces minteri]|uniref:Uncharacterized protein n=1 Tax=Cryomyces minteri TaxID=331657 RepID=A0A4V5NHV9_9PEZI|nr:hypothetical protein B0A49_07208 [Cryomyces minteri]